MDDNIIIDTTKLNTIEHSSINNALEITQRAISQFEPISIALNSYIKNINQNFRIIDLRILDSALISLNHEMQMISANYSSTLLDAVRYSIAFQKDSLVAISNMKSMTMEIATLLDSIRNSLPTQEMLTSFATSFYKPIVECQNIALLKFSSELRNAISHNLPKGFSSMINGLSMPAARRLSSSDIFSYNTEKRVIFNENAINESAIIKAFNNIVSIVDLLQDISDEDMLSFHTYLCNHPMFGLQHKVGQRINELVHLLNPIDTVDFDTSIYYRGRPFEDGQRPWSEQELKSAPYGRPNQGRFNPAGINSIYLADSVEGAANEIRKHSNDLEIAQIGHFSTRYQVRILNMANWNNSLAKFCSMPLDMRVANYNIRPEYLVPCFLAECLKHANVDGIKYKGGKNYFNYVFWEDHYFLLKDTSFFYYDRPAAVVNE